jgi:hypothetical protein
MAVAEVAGRRMMAEIDGDFVVFLIGARFNSKLELNDPHLRAGEYEALYGNMPAHGLGKAGRLVPASQGSSARTRLGVPTA